MRPRILMALPLALAGLSASPAALTAAPAGGPSPLVERIGNRAFIQVTTPSFGEMTGHRTWMVRCRRPAHRPEDIPAAPPRSGSLGRC